MPATTPSSRLLLAPLLLTAAAAAAWATYRVRATRRTHRTRGDGCRRADDIPIPGTPRWVRCASWEIGTGVTGFQWTRPDAQAAVLFQHGYGDYTQRWVKGAGGLITGLVQGRLDVYGIDMWGNGRSPGKRGVTDVHAAVRDHLAARQTLRGQSLPVFLVAHSLGGLVAMTSVIRDPRDIAGIVLIAPGLQYDVSRLGVAAAQVGGFLMPTLPGPLPAGEIDRLTHVPAAVDALRADPLFYTGRISWLTVAGGAAVSTANWKDYGEVTAPLLVVHGGADENTDPQGSARLVDAVRSRDRELKLIPGGWHSLLDDTAGRQTAADIVTWIVDRAALTTETETSVAGPPGRIPERTP